MRGRLLEGYSIRAHVPVQAYMDKCEPRRESLIVTLTTPQSR